MSTTEKAKAILTFLASQPDGSCRLNWMPEDMSFHAYRECREGGLLTETEGAGGFLEAAITAKGRKVLGRSK